MNDGSAPRTNPRLVDWSASRYGNAQAISDGDTSLTFAELRDDRMSVARGLIALGVRKGDRVAIWAPNSHYWVRFVLGVAAAGGVAVPLNTRYRGIEAMDVIERTSAVGVLIQSDFLGYDYHGALVSEVDLSTEEVATKTASLRFAIDVGQPGPTDGPFARHTWSELLALGTSVPIEVAAQVSDGVQPDDLAEIIFTSGTTGRSKGVRLTHGQGIELYETYGEIWGLRPGDRYLVSLPMFHAGGLKAGILVCLIHGVTIVPMPVFDGDAVLDLVERERITVMNGPPTVYNTVLNHPARRDRDLGSLRLAATGAAVVPVALVERAHRELPFEHFITAYGLTECCGTASMARQGDSSETIAHTNGRALPGVRVTVVDNEGNEVAAGTTGEVLIRGRNVSAGYWDSPDESAATFRDGWLHTGDIGSLDEDGNLSINDRLKDLFIVGGFNVSPAEIEQTLARHPGISEVAVVGTADDRLGEVPLAYVTRRTGETTTEPEIISWCRERLANFKVPRQVRFRDALPRNASGKVLKDVLRADSSSRPR